MQLQYGEHYAQKVEDRLLQYLQRLETVLPGDAYVDRVCTLNESTLGMTLNVNQEREGKQFTGLFTDKQGIEEQKFPL